MTDVMITVDGVPRRVRGEVTLAVALFGLRRHIFRRDGNNLPRGPLCAMGTCYECRVMVDGKPGVRACLEPVREGLEVETGE